MLAPYAGDVLVEHDVTFDLTARFATVAGIASAGTSGAGGDSRGNGSRATAKSWSCRSRIARCSAHRTSLVIPNGVDLARFAPEIERPGDAPAVHRIVSAFPQHRRVSIFRRTGLAHPCANALREITLTVVAGPDPLALLARAHRPALHPARRSHPFARVRRRRPPAVCRSQPGPRPDAGFGRHQSQGAGSYGHGARRGLHLFRLRGLGLEHMANVWIADNAEDFAHAIQTLLTNPDLRAAHRAPRPRPRGATLRLAEDRPAPTCHAAPS